MKKYEKGDVVIDLNCPSCGQKTAVKVNKNSCLYIYCTNKTGDLNCCCRMAWGLVVSRGILRKEVIEKKEILGILFGGIFDDIRKPENRDEREPRKLDDDRASTEFSCSGISDGLF